MIKIFKLKTLFVPALVLTGSLMFSVGAHASICSPDIANNIMKDVKGRIDQDFNDLDKRNNPAIVEQNANDIFGCTDIWPTGDFGFKIPNIEQILKDMGEKAMNKACDLARDKIREQTNKINNSIKLDTSMIDGFDELGLGNYELGSANASGGLSGKPDVNINNNSNRNSNSNTNWGGISDVINNFR